MEKIKAVFDKDTRNFHCYKISGTEVQGSLYVSKDVKEIPNELVIELTVKGIE